MVNFKVQKFRFEKILHIWMEWRKWFLEKVFYKNTYRCSANILVGVWEMLCRNIDIWLWKGLGDVLWSHRDIFHKNTERFSEKMLRVFLQNNKENFIEKIEICSAKKLRGVPQKYWEVFCRNKVFCRTAGLSSTLWHKKNNFLVKTYCVKSVQIRSFFWPVFSKNAGKYGPEKNSVFGHFSRSDYYISTNIIHLSEGTWG